MSSTRMPPSRPAPPRKGPARTAPPSPAAGRSAARQLVGKNIVWLASYPKSGNTWLRIFLANYLLDRQTPMPINQVHRIGMGDSTETIYRRVAGGPLDIADYRQTLALRGKVLGAIAGNGADLNLVKTHNARTRAFGVALIPPALTRSAIYILRNPLDMVLSYARQYGLASETAAEAIGRADNCISGANGTVTQFIGSWSQHVLGWTRCRDFSVLTLRYEDLQADPEAAFARVIRHLGMTPEPERIARAARFSSFDELRKQEDAEDFVERSPNAERFFHSGRSGQWREELAPEAVDRIRKDHEKVMRAFGYLDA